MKTLTTVCLLVALTFAGACATNPGVNTQTKVAKLGGDLMSAVKVVQETTAQLAQQRVLSEADAASAMVVYEKIGIAGQKLSTALTAYDAATSLTARQDLTRDVVATLDSINALVTSTLVPIGSAEARSQLSRLLQNVSQLILTIRGQVPDLAGGQ